MTDCLKNKRFNERVRLLASTFNILAIAFVIYAVLAPAVFWSNYVSFIDATTWIWIMAGLVLHLAAHHLLGALQLEDRQ